MNNLPHEIILHHIATTSSIFNSLRASMPDFARYCEKNRASYWNLRAKLRVFPAHMSGKCGCYYCYNVNRGSGNTSDYYDTYGHHNYVGVSNNLVPPVWKNRAKVWMVGDKIHREYDFAVIIKRKYFAHYRLGLKLPNGETNIELIYNNGAEDAE
jgi:hypothetical protein